MSFKTLRAAGLKAGGKVTVKVVDGETGESVALRIDGGLTAHTSAGIVAAARNGAKFNTKFIESVTDDGDAVTATHSSDLPGKVAQAELRKIFAPAKADAAADAAAAAEPATA